MPGEATVKECLRRGIESPRSVLLGGIYSIKLFFKPMVCICEPADFIGGELSHILFPIFRTHH